MAFTGLFAYRLLLLSQHWAAGPLSRHFKSSGSLAAAMHDPWLPSPWVGQPTPLDPLACTPQLLIIGAMKGGTTALFHYLNGSQPAIHYPNGSKSHVDFKPRYHPSIIGTHVTKELHFFDKQPVRTQTPLYQQQYFASFPGVDALADQPLAGRCSYAAQLGLSSSSKPALVRMEATAMYLAHPSAAANVQRLLPQVRMVALLREPVSRALSSVNMLFQRSPEYAQLKPLTPEYTAAWKAHVVTELRRQLGILSDCFTKLTMGRPVHEQIDQCVFTPTGTLAGVLHVHVGLYAVHLERWLSHFAPEQLLIWSSNAFDERPQQHMDQLVHWLGLDPALTNSNSSSFEKLHERSYPTGSLPAALFQELVAFFQPHNERVFALLQRNGYGGLVQQLRRAWQLELAETIRTLQDPAGDVSDVLPVM
uniref:Sulfotransferase n=1 Tax=Tetradesmus obliquus TaxID=3088 RepID=A0A383WIM9_TETOB|eukprot:jgi/Sobl393_1/9814/SZX77318.1